MLVADDVEQILMTLLTQYHIDYDRKNYDESAIFTVKMFGLKIVYLNGQPFKRTILNGWNVVWIHPDYNIEKSRKLIIFGLMKGGYFHYLRHNYSNLFRKLITMEGWDREILNERLYQYKELPKYNYFRELDKDALSESSNYILSIDPGFFDFMP